MTARVLLALAAVILGWSAWILWRPLPVRYPHLTRPLFGRMDPDGDGRVSADEYEAIGMPEHPFEILDLDGDGGLDPGELEVFLVYTRADALTCPQG